MEDPADLPMPELVLEALAPGTEIVAPEGLRVGDAIPVTPQALGRWINIGSGPDQDLVIRDDPPGIARAHARLTCRDGIFRLQGRLQRNGLFLNGAYANDCTARPLADGDLIRIGPNVTLRFRVPPAPP